VKRRIIHPSIHPSSPCSSYGQNHPTGAVMGAGSLWPIQTGIVNE